MHVEAPFVCSPEAHMVYMTLSAMPSDATCYGARQLAASYVMPRPQHHSMEHFAVYAASACFMLCHPLLVCCRYGLAIGYYCSWLVRALMLLTSPISYPIGKLLDLILGGEHRALFRRTQLKALVDIHGLDEGLGGNLTADEIKVICGALDLTSKTAHK